MLLTTTSSPLWYTTYGANIWSEHFRQYLTLVGGSMPRFSRPTILNGSLYFSAPVKHPIWQNNATVFYDFYSNKQVLARSWLITREQFEGIYAIENGRRPGVPFEEVEKKAYGKVLDLSHNLRGKEAVAAQAQKTITAPRELFTRAMPTRDYVTFMQKGLAEAHGLSRPGSAKYLLQFLPK